MTLVIDASVAVKWVAPEVGHGEAIALLDAGEPRVAPEFIVVECANTLWKKVSRGQLTRSQAFEGIELISAAMHKLIPDATLAADALEFSLAASHPVYDCLYIVCARREDATLVTDDLRLMDKLRNAPHAPPFQPLRDNSF